MKPNIKIWFNILRTGIYYNGFRQYIFYLSNLDVYRFIEYSNVLRIMENIKNKNNVLDLGTGYSISPFLYPEAKALDINKKACMWQTKNGTESLISDLCNIPIQSKSIDVVVAISSIEHVPDDRKVYTEINRILKKSGCLILSVPYSSKESNIERGLRKGIAVELLNSKYLEKFWEIILSKENLHYFKEQTKTDFLNKIYGREELFSIIKEENWIIEEELVFGKWPFRSFFNFFPPGWFIPKDLIFGYIFHNIDTILENKNGNTILLKITKPGEGN
ncbi:MAG: class I SAM-dependent methyltransferase [Candidatus Methanoperedens sp.]